MRRKHFEPYGIVTEYEYKTYKYIGKDYGNSKTANLGCINNFRRFYRRKINKNQKKYAICNTYTEWENHVKKVLDRNNIKNSTDLIHWLYAKRNDAEDFLEATKTILIPIYIALLSLIHYFFKDLIEQINIYAILIVVFIIVFYSAKWLFYAQEKVSFYKDFIQIAERELSN